MAKITLVAMRVPRGVRRVDVVLWVVVEVDSITEVTGVFV